MLQVCGFSTLQAGSYTSFHRRKRKNLPTANELAAHASGLPPSHNIETAPTPLLPAFADCQRGRRETVR